MSDPRSASSNAAPRGIITEESPEATTMIHFTRLAAVSVLLRLVPILAAQVDPADAQRAMREKEAKELVDAIRKGEAPGIKTGAAPDLSRMDRRTLEQLIANLYKHAGDLQRRQTRLELDHAQLLKEEAARLRAESEALRLEVARREAITPLTLPKAPAPAPAAAPAKALGAPTITAIEPLHAPPGKTITIKGAGLASTRMVLFSIASTDRSAGGYISHRRAGFKVVGNGELRVQVPLTLRSDLQAVITIQTAEGVVFTAPKEPERVDKVMDRLPSTQPYQPLRLAHVVAGGIVKETGFSLVERGGAVTERAGELVFVKAGGAIASGYLVFHEKGASLPQEGGGFIGTRANWFEVGAIESASTGLFTIDPLQLPPGRAPDRPAPPLIDSFAPKTAMIGEIVTVRGKGFLAAKRVMIASDRGTLSAPFIAIADDELALEVPTGFNGGPLVIVIVADLGTAFTWPKNAKVVSAITESAQFAQIAKGGIVSRSCTNVLIGDGGIVTGTCEGLILLQKGGTITDSDTPSWPSPVLIREPGARTGDKLKPREEIQTPVLLPCPVEAMLELRYRTIME